MHNLHSKSSGYSETNQFEGKTGLVLGYLVQIPPVKSR